MIERTIFRNNLIEVIFSPVAATYPTSNFIVNVKSVEAFENQAKHWKIGFIDENLFMNSFKKETAPDFEILKREVYFNIGEISKGMLKAYQDAFADYLANWETAADKNENETTILNNGRLEPKFGLAAYFRTVIGAISFSIKTCSNNI